MKALIFAAGLGTRLRPITDNMPKALVPVNGTPVLEMVIRKLQSAGINEFVINVFHFADMVEKFLCEHDGFGSHICISREDRFIDGRPGTEPLETGGGIKRAARFLDKEARFLVHNVDILSNLDIRWFISEDAAFAEEPLASLLVCESSESDRYLLFDEGMRLVGWTNVRTGEVKTPFPGFDVKKSRRLSFCGIHILSARILPMMESWPERFSIIDFYLAAAAHEIIRGVIVPQGFRMIDIGSPEKLDEAQKNCFYL
ncbi:MAG TPA: mannose-1-phosphate guanyltransferase [Rikenellaceae bacterium]|nr:mannose-1-phosphate guanyltransferase [Rikenellaceae bacterium]HCZ22582.1 mannose-1-phosphate guanyltransferase [Rikenellaceae bacterium]